MFNHKSFVLNSLVHLMKGNFGIVYLKWSSFFYFILFNLHLVTRNVVCFVCTFSVFLEFGSECLEQ